MYFDILWEALLVFEDQYEDRGMDCGREKLFGWESKVMVRGLRNVELEEVFLENRMDDEGEWFVLERELFGFIFASHGGTRTLTLACAWKVIFSSSGTPSSSSSAKSATKWMCQSAQLCKDIQLSNTYRLSRSAEEFHFDAKSSLLRLQSERPVAGSSATSQLEMALVRTTPSIIFRSSSCASANSSCGRC
jgi:hypothetical protein